MSLRCPIVLCHYKIFCVDKFSLPWVEDLLIKSVIPKYRYPGPIINEKLISIAHFNEYWYGEFLCH